MNEPFVVDLHCHSTASDGTMSPADVVRRARQSGLSALALTDHDTLAGVPEAGREANRLGLDFLTGIEVTCAFPRPGTMHVLGYGLDPASTAARKLTATLGAARDERMDLMIGRLNHLGLNVSRAEVEAGMDGTGGSIGRPHVARVLLAKGYVHSTRDAFERYLGGGGAAYVDTSPLAPEQVITLIREAGGLASLAHPYQLRRREWSQLEALVRELAGQGLEGVETHHSSHTDEQVQRLTRLADRLDLLTTGGSDFHGSNKPWIRLGEVGRRTIPRAFYDAVVERIDSRRAVRAA
jgi:3',5'-nucleoside bisphosphate phosphatase